jgi:hypothetical protein
MIPVEAMDPSGFVGLSRRIDEKFEFGELPDWVFYMTIPKRMADRKFTYNFNDGSKHPDEFFEDMRGDCQDWTTLMLSMYLALGLEAKTICVDSQSGQRHVLVLVRPPNRGIEKVCDALKLFYHRNRGFEPDSIAVHDMDDPMVVAGSTITEYVGDLDSLVDMGYAIREQDDTWRWFHEVYVREPDDG